MNKPCPTKTKRQCVWWEVTAMTVLVFLAVYTIVARLDHYTVTKELVISIGATCAILWCVWVVRTFRNIMSWWIDMQSRIEAASQLLGETKKEISELKIINQGK